MKTTKKTFTFVVDTENYAGNFIREMCALIVGARHEFYHDWSKKVAEETRKVYSQPYSSINSSIPFEFIEEHLLCEADPVSASTNRVPCYLISTTGWWNGGYGKIQRGKPPKGTFPAYQSVGFKFDARPPEYLLVCFKKRARCFNAAYRGFNPSHEDIEITGFRLLEETTTTKVVTKTI